MIKVYFETKGVLYAELVAVFQSDELYMKCLPTLKEEAKSRKMFVTESDQLVPINEAVIKDDQAHGFSCLKWSSNDFNNSEKLMNEFFKNNNEQIIQEIQERIEIFKLDYEN